MRWNDVAGLILIAIVVGGMSALLLGCKTSAPPVLGEQVSAPYGYSAMCYRDPEAFGCP